MHTFKNRLIYMKRIRFFTHIRKCSIHVSFFAVRVVMSHIWMGRVTHMNESCHAYEWVVSHVWMSHVTNMNYSCHTYEWVVSHIWMSHVLPARRSESATAFTTRTCSHSYVKQTWICKTHTNKTRHIYEWNMSHIWMSHVTHMDESRPTCAAVRVSNRIHHQNMFSFKFKTHINM